MIKIQSKKLHNFKEFRIRLFKYSIYKMFSLLNTYFSSRSRIIKVANRVMIIFFLTSTMSSGKVNTLAPIFLAIETAQRALSILDSTDSSLFNKSYRIDAGLMASIKSHITIELEIDASLKPLIDEDFSAFLSF